MACFMGWALWAATLWLRAGAWYTAQFQVFSFKGSEKTMETRLFIPPKAENLQGEIGDVPRHPVGY